MAEKSAISFVTILVRFLVEELKITFGYGFQALLQLDQVYLRR
jgi:hypothetical protein